MNDGVQFRFKVVLLVTLEGLNGVEMCIMFKKILMMYLIQTEQNSTDKNRMPKKMCKCNTK